MTSSPRPKLLVLTQGECEVRGAQSPASTAKLERVLGLNSPTGSASPSGSPKTLASRLLAPRKPSPQGSSRPPTLALTDDCLATVLGTSPVPSPSGAHRHSYIEPAALDRDDKTPHRLSYVELTEEQRAAMHAAVQEKITQRREQWND